MLLYFNKYCVYIKYRLQKQTKKGKEDLLLEQNNNTTLLPAAAGEKLVRS